MRARLKRLPRNSGARSRWTVHAIAGCGSTLAIPILLVTLLGCEVAFPREHQRPAGAGGSGPPSGGSAGSAGAGGSAGSAAGGTAGGGYSGQENCLDGKDNDGNGFVDCADPACAGYSCQPGPPSGWQGYFRTAGDTYDTTSSPPVCPDGTQPEKYASSPAPTTCTPCTCGGLTGACEPARVDCAENTDCTGATDWSSKFQSCAQAGYPAALSCKLEPATPSAGAACPASGGELAVKDTFTRWLYACGGANQAGGGCGAGTSCAAPGAGAYSGSVCIRKVGEQTCPAGWSTRLVGYAGGTDTRSCSACTCTPSGIVCGAGAYTFYDHKICGCGLQVICQPEKVVDSTSCFNLTNLLNGSILDQNGDWAGKYTLVPTPQSGSCTSSGGQPSGGIQTTGAVTFCCL